MVEVASRDFIDNLVSILKASVSTRTTRFFLLMSDVYTAYQTSTILDELTVFTYSVLATGGLVWMQLRSQEPYSGIDSVMGDSFQRKARSWICLRHLHGPTT